jgi:hypothetical protein
MYSLLRYVIAWHLRLMLAPTLLGNTNILGMVRTTYQPWCVDWGDDHVRRWEMDALADGSIHGSLYQLI